MIPARRSDAPAAPSPEAQALARALADLRTGLGKISLAPRGDADFDLVASELNALVAEVSRLREDRRVLEDGIGDLVHSLTKLASLEFTPMPRSHAGDVLDAIAFLVNATMEEMQTLMKELQVTNERLVHAQRMDAVGKLAGGIAHDFNNLLGVITACATCATEELSEAGGDPTEDIAEILQAAERGAALTNQLLVFSRRHTLALQVLDLSEVVQGTEGMLGRLLGEPIQLGVTYAEELWLTRADRGQLEQILVNLAINARDAMPDGGQLMVETRNMTLDDDFLQTHPDVSPGEYVMLAVSDTGVGMPCDVSRRAFEPFFTTKGPGEGTGLGLSTCFGIVRQLAGHISIYSEPGRGTTMKVLLPRVIDERAPLVSLRPARPREGTGETVLVIEDDDALRRITVRLLRRRKYEVLSASSGEEALVLAESYTGPIDLVLTDVVMPGLSGRPLVDRLIAMRPDARVLYMSGYTETSIVHHGVMDDDIAFIPKPFTASSLARAVRERLDADQRKEEENGRSRS